MVEKRLFSKLNDGTLCYEYILKTKKATASIISYGATLKNLFVPSKNGVIDVVLGYNSLTEYQDNDGYFGATIGRNCNRLYGKKFNVNGKTFKLNVNDRNKNNLHGGLIGFDKKNFTDCVINNKENSVELKLFSKNKEEGFLGNMLFSVKYTLKGSELIIEYFAKADEDTVANFTNHSYFNLDGGINPILDTYLKIDADCYTPVNKYLVPNGKILPVKRTPFNFLKYKQIKKDIFKNTKQLNYMGGYDVNLRLNNNGEFKKVASAYSKNSLVRLDVYTDRIALQFYSGNFITERKGKNGIIYGKRQGFCLETQSFPDALNHPNFPSIILQKDKEFYSKTSYKFTMIKE